MQLSVTRDKYKGHAKSPWLVVLPARLAADAAAAADADATGRAAHRAATEDLTYLRPYIAVCAPNSKTGGQRHIEMHATLAAWLLACRPADAEPGSLVTPAKNLHANLGALRYRAGFGGGTWQHDRLCHSYATYYLKVRHGEITRLQLNMGHRSAQLLYSRYVNMAGTTRDMAEKWWQILPD